MWEDHHQVWKVRDKNAVSSAEDTPLLSLCTVTDVFHVDLTDDLSTSVHYHEFLLISVRKTRGASVLGRILGCANLRD